jgi:hypothetical protein
MSTTDKNDQLEFRVRLHHETAKAVLVSRTGFHNHATWLPKHFARCVYVGLSYSDKEMMREQDCPDEDYWPHILVLPRWLARDRGFI